MDIEAKQGTQKGTGLDSQSHDTEVSRDHSVESKTIPAKETPNDGIKEQSSNSNVDDNDDDDKEGDDEEDEYDKEKVIEKSHNERFLKKNAQIIAYKVPGVNAYASFEIKTGKEVLWKDVICDASESKEGRLLTQLKKMRRSHHPNCMRILDCWRNEKKSRISFITERPDETYTTLRHWFNISRLSRNSLTTKRLVRQVVSGLKYFADHGLIHGNISVDSILIYGTNLKLGPFSLDAFWHTHTVRKSGTKKNYYLSNDWYDPAVRITSLTDAYAMGVVCLEMALWCTLDAELSAPDCDVSKYVNEKIESLDDPLLRNFMKVCISGNKHHGIAELFDTSAFFEPPSLRHVAAKVITDGVTAHFASLQQQSQQSNPTGQTGQSTSSGPPSKQTGNVSAKLTADINGAYQELLRSARSSFEDDSVIVKTTLRDGSSKQLLFKDVAQYYISFKFLEDVDHGYYPQIKFDSTGTAIVPQHVHRIIKGDWRKTDSETKEREKVPPSHTTASGSVASGGGVSGATESGTADGKPRRDSREIGTDGEKVSPPRAVPGSAVAAVQSGQAPAHRQAAASPARQAPPSKLPVADAVAVRRSGSSTGIAGGGKQVDGGVGGSAGGSGNAASANATGSTTVSSAAGAGQGSRTPASGSTARDGKRSSASRGGSTTSTTGASSGTSGANVGHVVRRTGVKSSRGPPRSSTGSAVTLRRKGTGSTPMSQRTKHASLGEGSGRVSRGGRSSHGSHARLHADSSSSGRLRRTTSDSGGARDSNRLSSAMGSDKMSESDTGTDRTDTTSASVVDPEAIQQPDTTVEVSVDLSNESRREAPLDDQPISQQSLSDEDYEDFDYYEDDLEEVCEEDEDEYEYQFQQRGPRNAIEHEVIDVDQPADEERGKAFFTDVFYEYLGLGRWLLVVKFHLLRCREDPRGNPYREIMLQLNDTEWHDIDDLADRLTASGLIMRPEERSTLRQYLDAARHNRPLRETSVQDGCRGPDPQDLAKRLEEVQKRQIEDAESISTEPELGVSSTSRVVHREEKPGSVEATSRDFGEITSDSVDIEARKRSHLVTPMSEMTSSFVDASANRSRSESRLQFRERASTGPQALDSPLRAPGEVTDANVSEGHCPSNVDEKEGESEEDGKGSCHYLHSRHHSASAVQSQNPLEPLNKLCPFCDKCDYLLVDGPTYLRSPCYHCRVMSAEKNNMSGEQLYRLHTQNRVPWPLFLQKYFDWPPLDRVSYESCIDDCQWRSRVVCVCNPNSKDVWPPCVEFPWLYNPPKHSLAYRMQMDQVSRGVFYGPSLKPSNFWCQHQKNPADKIYSSNQRSIETRVGHSNSVTNADSSVPTCTPSGVSKSRDPELTARNTRRSRSLTVGPSDHALWKQLFLVSQTSSLAAAKALGTYSCWDSSSVGTAAATAVRNAPKLNEKDAEKAAKPSSTTAEMSKKDDAKAKLMTNTEDPAIKKSASNSSCQQPDPPQSIIPKEN